MKPMIGTMVFYYEPRFAEPQAAVITLVGDAERVNLMVFPHNGGPFPVYGIDRMAENNASNVWWGYRINPASIDQVRA